VLAVSLQRRLAHFLFMLSFSKIVKQHNKSVHRKFITLRFVKCRDIERYRSRLEV